MTIGIQINGEFLDLNPGTVLELEEENPFLQLGNEVQGQYSLPFTVRDTEKNMRLLGNPNLLNMRKSAAGINAIAKSNGQQHSKGIVKIEGGNSNINRLGEGTISCYYLFGVSDFYKLVENKTLADCNYGPDITYPWRTTTNYTGDGFWAHVTTVMNATPGTFDYAFLPIINEGGLTRYQAQGPCILNNYGAITTGDGSANNPYVKPANYTLDLSWVNFRLGWRNEICPFPYLKFVLQKMFASVGWAVEGAMLNDPDFARIVVLHNKIIDWSGPSDISAATGITQYVTYNLKNHVPRVKIGTFLIALSNRFGWWLNFDYRKKICTIRHRNNIVKDRTRRDVTSQAGAAYNFKVNTQAKIYSIKQAAAGGEKISMANYQGEVNNRYNLPAAAQGRENQLYYVKGENAYFICVSEDTNFTWEKAADNTFDLIQAGQTDEITTNCLVPDSYMDLLRDMNRDTLNRKTAVPNINIIPLEGDTDVFYLAYNFGLVDSFNSTNQVDYKYPMAGAGCCDNKGNRLTTNALVFELNDGPTERGLFANNWVYFLTFLQQREEITIPVNFTIYDLLNLDYTQTLVIRNAEYFIKNPHFTLPLKQFSNMELVRL